MPMEGTPWKMMKTKEKPEQWIAAATKPPCAADPGLLHAAERRGPPPCSCPAWVPQLADVPIGGQQSAVREYGIGIADGGGQGRGAAAVQP